MDFKLRISEPGCREWTCGHGDGGGACGESGMNGESSINIYTLPCVEWIAVEKLLCNLLSLVWCSVMT